ncbi:MAG: hypothetical protein IMY82_01610 [Chloroflexi bacterium]|nr:hypothetical protein [Chloroflexota bacterium]
MRWEWSKLEFSPCSCLSKRDEDGETARSASNGSGQQSLDAFAIAIDSEFLQQMHFSLLLEGKAPFAD